MSPHLEAADGAEVRNTGHETGDTESENARKVHALLREHPERYDEVADGQGKDCETVNNVGTDVFCPECKLRIGRIKIVHGMPSVFINHGTVKRIKT